MKLKIGKTYTADVVVVGGGTAGVFAAIAAAKTGAKTLLLEKNGMLGGTMTNAMVTYPGLFFAWGRQIIDGPCWESVERTVALGGGVMPKIQFQPEHHWDEQVRMNRFLYTTVLTQMCEEAGVQVLTNVMPAAAQETEDGVQLLLTEKTGLSEVHAKIAIDCTGDANLTVLAGYPVEKSEKQQPATLHNHLSGYEIENVSEAEFTEKFAAADMPDYFDAPALYHWLVRHKLDVHIPCEGRTVLERKAQYVLLHLYRFLRGIKGLEQLEIDLIADETGVRETNRIIGEGIVTAQEYITGYHYPDSVCYAFYPIDLHVMNGIEQTFHQENVVSRIPYGALIPRGAKHLLCAGRCISSDTYANSAVRVQASCMATGQAAGCAAAIAAKSGCGVKEVPYGELCQALEVIGAIIPKA